MAPDASSHASSSRTSHPHPYPRPENRKPARLLHPQHDGPLHPDLSGNPLFDPSKTKEVAKYPSGVPFVGYPDVPALRVTLGHRPKGRFKANLWDYDHPISFWRRDLKEAGIEEKKALTSNLRLVSSGTSATTFFWGYAVQAYDKKCAIMSEMLRSYSRDAFDAELLVVRCKMEASNDPQGFFEDWLRRAMPLMSSQTATAIFGIYVNDAGQQVRTASCSLDVLARVIWVWVCSKKSTKAALDWIRKHQHPSFAEQVALRAGLAALPDFPDVLWPSTDHHDVGARSQAFKDDTWRKEPLLRSALEARSPEEQKTGLLKYTKAQMAGIISSCWPVESGRVSRTILYRFAGKTASDYAPGLARLMLRSSNVISLEDIFGKALAAEIRDAQEKAHKEYEQHVQEQGPLNIEYVSSNRRMTIQALFWELATSALTDREKMDPESKEFEDARVELVTWMKKEYRRSENCRLCCQEMTTFRLTHGAGGSQPSNVSIDCALPRAHGHSYLEKANRQLLCALCNAIKFWYSMDTARLLVGSIREAVPLTDVDQRGFIVLRDEAKVRAAIPEPLTEQAVDWWTNKELNKLQKRCEDSEEGEGKVKECTITVNHIKELVLEGLCEDQISIQIHLGIAVPLVLLSIDRLNANKGYVPGNIRLTLIGWNLKRGNEPHDRAALPWRQAIGINKPAGVKMPATSWRTTRHA